MKRHAPVPTGIANVFVSLLAFGFAAATLAAPVLPAGKPVFKLKAIKVQERPVFGGLGPSPGAVGCTLDVQIASSPISNLSFPCGSAGKFTEDSVYVFRGNSGGYLICPHERQNISECLVCNECLAKEEELKRLNLLK